ncbi:hypothetical protein SALBM311S_03310 [Streptomyces alboniger]
MTDWARRIVAAAEAFDVGAQALRDRRDSRLRVAASMTIAEYLLPGWLLALRAQRPDTAVSLLAGNSTAVAERLLADEADLGFVEGLTVPTGLDSVVIAHDHLIVVTSPEHPWARRRRSLDASELAVTPLILRRRRDRGPGRSWTRPWAAWNDRWSNCVHRRGQGGGSQRREPAGPLHEPWIPGGQQRGLQLPHAPARSGLQIRADTDQRPARHVPLRPLDGPRSPLRSQQWTTLKPFHLDGLRDRSLRHAGPVPRPSSRSRHVASSHARNPRSSAAVPAQCSRIISRAPSASPSRTASTRAVC